MRMEDLKKCLIRKTNFLFQLSLKAYFFIPYPLKVCGTLQFLLFEHFVEYGKLI
jgi:hypothetical protein